METQVDSDMDTGVMQGSCDILHGDTICHLEFWP